MTGGGMKDQMSKNSKEAMRNHSKRWWGRWRSKAGGEKDWGFKDGKTREMKGENWIEKK